LPVAAAHLAAVVLSVAGTISPDDAAAAIERATLFCQHTFAELSAVVFCRPDTPYKLLPFLTAEYSAIISLSNGRAPSVRIPCDCGKTVGQLLLQVPLLQGAAIAECHQFMRHDVVFSIYSFKKAHIRVREVYQKEGEVVCTFGASWDSEKHDNNIQETDFFVNRGFKILKETYTTRTDFKSLCRRRRWIQTVKISISHSK
jgi:hypothetical protein